MRRRMKCDAVSAVKRKLVRGKEGSGVAESLSLM